jgi:hypothetical protein
VLIGDLIDMKSGQVLGVEQHIGATVVVAPCARHRCMLHVNKPRVTVDAAKIAALRSQGLSWAKIGEALGLGEGTVGRSAQASARNLSETAPVNL